VTVTQTGRLVELAVEVEVLNERAVKTLNRELVEALDGEVAEVLISTDSRPKK
jgi:hypothetical protein